VKTGIKKVFLCELFCPNKKAKRMLRIKIDLRKKREEEKKKEKVLVKKEEERTLVVVLFGE
jgi:hypothetical protein